MNKPWEEPLPEEELKHFRELKDVKVVIDVGARTSLDYLDIFPDAEYHLFEPYPPFYEWLVEATKDKPNVHVNPYALADFMGTARYSVGTQSFKGGLDFEYDVRVLDWYVAHNNIEQVDFLKIDTEGWDYKVLMGATNTLKKTKVIQYETWNKPENAFTDALLEEHFDCKDIGLRNMLCTRKS